MHKVLIAFKEPEHNGHVYHRGDEYPTKGWPATKERIQYLMSNKNRMGAPLLEEIQRDRKPPVLDLPPVVRDRPAKYEAERA